MQIDRKTLYRLKEQFLWKLQDLQEITKCLSKVYQLNVSETSVVMSQYGLIVRST